MPGPDPKDDSARAPSAAAGSPVTGVRIALIGDVHSAWDYGDVVYFNSSAYELLLIAGDLGGSQARDGLRVAGSMARLERRALVMPGNNDVDEYGRIAAELTYRQGQADLLEELLPDAAAPPRPTPGEPALRPRTCGYSLHEIGAAGFDATIVAGRPFAKGGDELAFPEALARSFGVRSLAESRERLAPARSTRPARTENLVFCSSRTTGRAAWAASATICGGATFIRTRATGAIAICATPSITRTPASTARSRSWPDTCTGRCGAAASAAGSCGATARST